MLKIFGYFLFLKEDSDKIIWMRKYKIWINIFYYHVTNVVL